MCFRLVSFLNSPSKWCQQVAEIWLKCCHFCESLSRFDEKLPEVIELWSCNTAKIFVMCVMIRSHFCWTLSTNDWSSTSYGMIKDKPCFIRYTLNYEQLLAKIRADIAQNRLTRYMLILPKTGLQTIRDSLPPVKRSSMSSKHHLRRLVLGCIGADLHGLNTHG